MSELERLNIQVKNIELAEVETNEIVPREKLLLLDSNLRQFGFRIIENRKEILAEKIQTVIIDLVYDSDEQLKTNLSDYLKGKLNYDIMYLSEIFSEIKGLSIEKFFISQKIERVKELLTQSDLSLNEIACMTRYSSVAHLSNQFKKKTGLTSSEFRNLYQNNKIFPGSERREE